MQSTANANSTTNPQMFLKNVRAFYQTLEKFKYAYCQDSLAGNLAIAYFCKKFINHIEVMEEKIEQLTEQAEKLTLHTDSYAHHNIFSLTRFRQRLDAFKSLLNKITYTTTLSNNHVGSYQKVDSLVNEFYNFKCKLEDEMLDEDKVKTIETKSQGQQTAIDYKNLEDFLNAVEAFDQALEKFKQAYYLNFSQKEAILNTYFHINPSEVSSYAPTLGIERLVKQFKELEAKTNTLPTSLNISLPPKVRELLYPLNAYLSQTSFAFVGGVYSINYYKKLVVLLIDQFWNFKNKLQNKLTGKETASTAHNLSEPSQANFDLQALPKELLLEIFQFLEGKELAYLSNVCTAYNTLLNDPDLFKKMPTYNLKTFFLNRHNRYIFRPLRIKLTNEDVVFTKYEEDTVKLILRTPIGELLPLSKPHPAEKSDIKILGEVNGSRNIACTFFSKPDQIYVFDNTTLEQIEVKNSTDIFGLCKNYCENHYKIENITYNILPSFVTIKFTDTVENTIHNIKICDYDKIEGISKASSSLFTIKGKNKFHVYNIATNKIHDYKLTPKRQ
jgi:hypothetical protein